MRPPPPPKPKKCFGSRTVGITHAKGCRRARPRCRYRRERCDCARYHFPHRPGSGLCGDDARWFALVYGPERPSGVFEVTEAESEALAHAFADLLESA